MNRQQRRAAARSQKQPGNNPSGDARSQTDISDLFAAAVRHHHAGRLPEAETHYRRILAIDPNRADVLFNLAVLLKQQGKLADAIVIYRKTIELAPANAEANYNLGNLLFGLGRFDEAVDCYRQATSLKPQHADAYCNLGVALKRQDKLDEATAALRQATAINPDHAEACCNLGDVQMAMGRLDQAAAAFRKAIRIKPRHALAYSGLAVALTGQGQLDEAIIAYRRSIEMRPDNAEVHYNLGNVLKTQVRLDEAVAAYRQAIAIKSDLLEAHVNLGNVLAEQGDLEQAAAAYGRAIAIKPDNAVAHYNIGNVFKDQGKLEQAIAAYRRAIAINPRYAEAHANLAITLTAQGRVDEALAEYRQAIDIAPDDAELFSNYLLCLGYSEAETPESLLAAHRDWDRRFGRQPAQPCAYSNERTAERRLRIGYVSPDFRSHSVAYFFEPLLAAHDRQAVEAFCYSDVMRPDAVTMRLQGLADHWLSTVGMADDVLAERIRTDRIDILVDLAGHTGWNRLRVFTRKPAPVQATWLGYSNTTGLRTIDYRLVDDITDPPGPADAGAAETLLRLPGGFLCYAAPNDAPPPAAPPCLKTGAVTFGSFNNPAKLSAATLDLWARLLTRLPNSLLLLKGKAFTDGETCRMVLRRLAERGIAEERVQLLGWLPSSIAHLSLYERIDIALDPFPYNGTTTTCEALWMGVPVVTLKGHRHCARVGASLLSHAGMADCIARSIDHYVEIALALAADAAKLQEIRRDLRQRLAAAPLCDAKGFANKIENAYRFMWQAWCEA